MLCSVVLRMSTALGYEFDECAARVEFESAVEMSTYHAIKDFFLN
jgi:hypothetical protein